MNQQAVSYVQRSNYCSDPYSKGFDYALKMRDMNLQKNDETPVTPYEESSYEHSAFLDGYRDGVFTSLFHSLM
jgi:hypothetical protein